MDNVSFTRIKKKENETTFRYVSELLFKMFIIITVIIGIVNIVLYATGNAIQTPWRHQVNGKSNYENSNIFVILGYVSIISSIFSGIGIFMGNIYNLDFNHKFFKYFVGYVGFSLINSIIVNAWWLTLTFMIQFVFFYIRYATWKKINTSEENLEENKVNFPDEKVSLMNWKWWTFTIIFILFYFIIGVILLVPDVIVKGKEISITILNGTMEDHASGIIYDANPWLDIISSSLLLIGVLLVTKKEKIGWVFYIISFGMMAVLYGKEAVWPMVAQYALSMITVFLLGASWYLKDKEVKKNFKEFIGKEVIIVEEELENNVYEDNVDVDLYKKYYQYFNHFIIHSQEDQKTKVYQISKHKLKKNEINEIVLGSQKDKTVYIDLENEKLKITSPSKKITIIATNTPHNKNK